MVLEVVRTLSTSVLVSPIFPPSVGGLTKCGLQKKLDINLYFCLCTTLRTLLKVKKNLVGWYIHKRLKCSYQFRHFI